MNKQKGWKKKKKDPRNQSTIAATMCSQCKNTGCTVIYIYIYIKGKKKYKQKNEKKKEKKERKYLL